MQKEKFSITIKASKKKIWLVLWGDKTFRDWANFIDEGTYMVGEMKEGKEVQFISSNSGYGVTSFIDKLVLNEFVLFKHMADTKERGEQQREKEWSGGAESYSLKERGRITTLIVELDVPPEQIKTFRDRVPKALNRIKELAEERSVG